jgi:hypothetical protein
VGTKAHNIARDTRGEDEGGEERGGSLGRGRGHMPRERSREKKRDYILPIASERHHYLRDRSHGVDDVKWRGREKVKKGELRARSAGQEHQ